MSDQLLSADPSAGLLSTDPGAGLVPPVMGSHSEARIGAPSADAPVTLGDLVADPGAAFARIGQILKKDVTDPKTWMSVALMYFGPKVLPYVPQAIGGALRASARGAIRGTAAIGDVVAPDVIGIASPRLGRAVDLAQRLRAGTAGVDPGAPPGPVDPTAPHLDRTVSVPAGSLTPAQIAERMQFGTGTPTPMRDRPPVYTPRPTPGSVETPLTPLSDLAAPAAAPAASPRVAPTPPAAPAPPPPAPTSPAASSMSPQRIRNEVGLAARRAKVTLTADQAQAVETLVQQGTAPAEAVATVVPPVPPKLKITAAEMKVYTALRKSGTSHQAAVEAVQAARDLAARLATPTTATAQQAVTDRNLTGRWPAGTPGE